MLLDGAVRAAELWHGEQTGGPNEEAHAELTRLMRQALAETFGVSTKQSTVDQSLIELIESFYPQENES